MAIDIGALQRAHPDWHIQDAIMAPNGGIWAVGADGGVFSLNAQGGTDGTVAPFFGSFPGTNQGTRNFVSIRPDPDTGGYTLISNQPGQNVTFVGNTPIGAGTSTPTPEPTKKIDFNDADLNQLTATLKEHGLGDLVDVAWSYYKDPTKGAGSAEATLAYLPTTTQYRDHFPGLVELGQQGRAWTPAQWNNYYNDLQDAAVSAGLPPGMIDRADIGKMLIGGVSKQEALGRIQAAGQSVYNADPLLIAQMRQRGFTDGDLTAFYLDPDKAAPLLERKEQEMIGRIGAAAQRTGYDPFLSTETVTGLRKLGVDEQEAEQGFATLSDLHPLFANTAGETMAGEDITREEQLGAQFGQNTAAQREITQRRQSRQAAFQGGGGAQTGGTGRSGLG